MPTSEAGVVPEISVIIPTYNSAAYLAQAVDSVLAQSHKDLEALVIDDGSADDTEQVMRRYGLPVRYLRQANQGVAVARNRGIEESRARWIAFLDADDTWLPHKLERQMAALRESPGARACYSAFTVVSSDLDAIGVRRSPREGTALEDLVLRGNVIGSICTVVCDRALFDRTGGFDPALSQCADWDMWLRLAVHTDFLYIDEPLVTYRQHGSNMSRDVARYERDTWRVLDKAFKMPGMPEALKRKRRLAFGRAYMVLAACYFHAGRHADFLRCAAAALVRDVRQAGYLLAFPARVAARLRATATSEAP
jgi:glycosyltransferase involved in cell wall biosynthesis